LPRKAGPKSIFGGHRPCLPLESGWPAPNETFPCAPVSPPPGTAPRPWQPPSARPHQPSRRINEHGWRSPFGFACVFVSGARKRTCRPPVFRRMPQGPAGKRDRPSMSPPPVRHCPALPSPRVGGSTFSLHVPRKPRPARPDERPSGACPLCFSGPTRELKWSQRTKRKIESA